MGLAGLAAGDNNAIYLQKTKNFQVEENNFVKKNKKKSRAHRDEITVPSLCMRIAKLAIVGFSLLGIAKLGMNKRSLVSASVTTNLQPYLSSLSFFNTTLQCPVKETYIPIGNFDYTTVPSEVNLAPNAPEEPFKQFFADRERVWEVQGLVQGIIRDARNHQGFIDSLGRFRGENSNENKKLKKIFDRGRLHLTPKNLMDLAIQHISLEAAEVMFLINKGFIQIKKSVPENIQKDLVRLNLAVADLTKRL